MIKTRYAVSHGWVVSISPSPRLTEDGRIWCVVGVRHADGTLKSLTIGRPHWGLRQGAEISYAYLCGARNYVVALVDHSAQQGLNVYRQAQRPRPDKTDVGIHGAVLGTALLALGIEAWRAWPLMLALCVVYWGGTWSLPRHWLHRRGVKVDMLVDQAYQSWRQAHEDRSTPLAEPASSENAPARQGRPVKGRRT